MKCPRCQHDNREGRRFCAECGASLALACPACSFANEPGEKFCGGCGAPLEAPAGTAPDSRFSSPESYTPKHLAERILTSKAALEGERKQVTVLFADLKGSTELLADRDPEEARRLLDPVLTLMMEAVHRYEGTVNQVMGDGIMALFGAPIAQEDHAVRACYSALRMQETVKRYAEDVRRSEGVPIQIRVGLNSGEVVVRSIGNDLHMDYTAVGQVTHLAARMEQLATPGSILLGPTTLAPAEGQIQVEPLGPMAVKGFPAPIDVYELTGVGSARSRFQVAAARGLNRFVGRDGEVAQLDRALEQAQQGQGQLVAMVGEAGVGKSRLLWEFTHSDRTQGCLVLDSGSVSHGKASALSLITELLKSYFQIEDRDPPRTAREKVLGKIVSLDRRLDDCVPPVLALLSLTSDDPEWEGMEPSARRQRALQAIKRLLLRETQVQPVVLILEDLQWIDAESQVFLDAMVEGLPAARLLLLVTYRLDYQHSWANKTYYRQLRLDPLAPASATTFLERLLGPEPGLEAVARLLIERTGGNPLFLEESVRALVESEALAGERGAYRLAMPIGGVQVPATVQTIMAARIDRLSPDDKRLLQVAAVIGREIPLSLLERLADAPDTTLQSGLARLQAAEFLHEASLFPDIVYAFKHGLTHEVSYGSLLREHRRSLHARVVDALEQMYADQTDQHVVALGHHAMQAEIWDRAHRYLRGGAAQALRVAASSEAARLLEQAVAALRHLPPTLERDEQELETSLELWSAYFEAAQFAQIVDLERQIEPLTRSLSQEVRLAEVLVRRAQRLWARNEFRDVLKTAEDVRRLAAPDDVRTHSYAQFLAGSASRDLGAIPGAIEYFAGGARLFETMRFDHPDAPAAFPILVNLLAWQSEAHAVLGHHADAITTADQALAVALGCANSTALVFANAYLGYARLLHGEIADALPALQQALAAAPPGQFSHATSFARAFLAYGLALDGQHAPALEVLDEHYRLRAPGASQQSSRFGVITAATHLVAGRPDDALRELDFFVPLARRVDARGHLPTLLRLRAETLLRYSSANLDEVLCCCQEARDLATEIGLRPELAHCLAVLGRAHARAGKTQSGQEHLEAARALFRDLGMDYWLRMLATEADDA